MAAVPYMELRNAKSTKRRQSGWFQSFTSLKNSYKLCGFICNALLLLLKQFSGQEQKIFLVQMFPLLLFRACCSPLLHDSATVPLHILWCCCCSLSAAPLYVCMYVCINDWSNRGLIPFILCVLQVVHSCRSWNPLHSCWLLDKHPGHCVWFDLLTPQKSWSP